MHKKNLKKRRRVRKASKCLLDCRMSRFHSIEPLHSELEHSRFKSWGLVLRCNNVDVRDIFHVVFTVPAVDRASIRSGLLSNRYLSPYPFIFNKSSIPWAQGCLTSVCLYSHSRKIRKEHCEVP